MEFIDVPQSMYDNMDSLESIDYVQQHAKKARHKRKHLLHKPKFVNVKGKKRRVVRVAPGEIVPRGTIKGNANINTAIMPQMHDPDLYHEDSNSALWGKYDEFEGSDHWNPFKKLKQFGKFVGSEAKKVGKFAVGSVANIALAPLFPFKGMMKKALKKVGQPTTGDMHTIVMRFYEHVVKKHPAHLDSPTAYYDNFDFNNFENHSDAIGIVIDAILDFVKKMKKVHSDGKAAIGSIEDIVGGGANRVLDQLHLKERLQPIANEAVERGALQINKNMIGAIVGVIVVIVIIVVIAKN
jgi:hypothetical protein